MHQAAMFAAKAASSTALKTAFRLMENMTDEEREQLRGQISEVSAAIKATTLTMAASSSVKELRKRHQEVMHPSTTAVIARRLVQVLRDRGLITAKVLAEQAGTTVEDEDFGQALDLALADGRIIAPFLKERGDGLVIHESDRLSARTAASILEPHPLVRSSGQAEDYKKRIVEVVHEIGAATINELRAAVGAGDTARADTVVAFEAGLEEALDQELIQWVGRSSQPSLYAVPEKESDHPWAQDQIPSLAEASRRLRHAVAALMTELATVRHASSARGHAGAPQSANALSAPPFTGGRARPPKPPGPGDTLDAS